MACIRRLRYYTKRGHSAAVTSICPGMYFQNDACIGSADQLVVTGSKDGSAIVWEMDTECSAFRMKFLLEPYGQGEYSEKGVINDLVCFMINPGLQQLGQPLYDHGFAITATLDGCQIWYFKPNDMHGTDPALQCVDGLNRLGLPERWVPDGKCQHFCLDCGNTAAVLCLALAPPRTEELSQQSGYYFSFFAGTTEGRARLWDVFADEKEDTSFSVVEGTTDIPITGGMQDDPYMENERGKAHLRPNAYRLRHARASQINCIRVAQLISGQTVVASGDTLGLVKLWLLGPQPVLLMIFSHEKYESVSSLDITPAADWHSSQYMVTCAGKVQSACYVWQLPEKVDDVGQCVHSDKTMSLAKHLFRATSLAIYDCVVAKNCALSGNELNISRRISPSDLSPVSYYGNAGFAVISGSIDFSAKMWPIVTTDGKLTAPLHETDKRTDLAEQLGLVMRKFDHEDGRVNCVSICNQSIVKIELNSQVAEESDVPDVSKYMSRNGSDSLLDIRTRSVLLTGSDDKTGQMWNAKNGQPLRAFRAATYSEMFTPVILEIVTFIQLIGFAFSDDFQWKESTSAPASAASMVFLVDFSELVEFFKEKKALLTVVCIFFVVSFACVFNILVLCDAVQQASARMRNIENRPAFRLELFEMRTGYGRLSRGPEHQRYWSAWKYRWIAGLMITIGSTVLTVTICKMSILAFDCERISSAEALAEGRPKYHLSWSPETECYATIEHILLVCLVVVVIVPYLWLLQPYNLVLGDAMLVARKDIFNVRRWRRNCEQQAGLVYLGTMQSRPQNMFITTIVTSTSKILCPCIQVMMTQHPEEQACSLLTVTTLDLICRCLFPPYAKMSMNMFIIMCKLATCHAFVCALVSEIVNDPANGAPSVIWYVGLATIGAIFLPLISCSATQEERREEQRNLAMLRPQAIDITATCNSSGVSLRHLTMPA